MNTEIDMEYTPRRYHSFLLWKSSHHKFFGKKGIYRWCYERKEAELILMNVLHLTSSKDIIVCLSSFVNDGVFLRKEGPYTKTGFYIHGTFYYLESAGLSFFDD